MIAVPQMRCALAWEKRFVTEPTPQTRFVLAREQRIGDKIRDFSMRCALAREKRFIYRSGPVPPARGSTRCFGWAAQADLHVILGSWEPRL